MTVQSRLIASVTLVLTLILAPAAYSQGLKAGTMEVGGYGGFANLRAEGESESKAQFGGGFAAGVSDSVAAYVDFGYIPMGGASVVGVEQGTQYSAEADGKLYAVEGGCRSTSSRSQMPRLFLT